MSTFLEKIFEHFKRSRNRKVCFEKKAIK
ncbi:CLUMA_CG013179, isoform A [Clunio marinus]|uniref:CLUMA_CG013179, isoform A n=1 Tax=Clunio marinus TaxID=568069 RepID=A0A1J1IK06_9DIPT|nr:CLUMA_CG013179, isoform A [Clunio marinus]